MSNNQFNRQGYNPWYKEEVNEGVFNQEDNDTVAMVNNYTVKIHKIQYQYRVRMPKDMCAEPTDKACFYAEKVPGCRHPRRVFELLSKAVWESLDPLILAAKNPRNLNTYGPRNEYLMTLVPYAKLFVPAGNWTHLRFHLTPKVNLYYLEFIDIELVKKDTFIANTQGNSGFEPLGITWD